MDPERFRVSSQLDGGCDRDASQASSERHPGRGGRRGNEGRVWTQPADSVLRLRSGAAHRLRQRRKSVACAGRGPARTAGCANGHRRTAAPDYRAGLDGKHSAGGWRRDGGTRGCRWSCEVVAGLGLSKRALPSDQHHAVVDGFGVRLRAGACDGNPFRRGSCVACNAHRSRRGSARVGPGNKRSCFSCAQGAAAGASGPVCGAGGGCDDAGQEPEQAREPGFWIRSQRARGRRPA